MTKQLFITFQQLPPLHLLTVKGLAGSGPGPRILGGLNPQHVYIDKYKALHAYTVQHTLRKNRCLPSVLIFAMCIFLTLGKKLSLPSVKIKILSKINILDKAVFAKCFIFDTS